MSIEAEKLVAAVVLKKLSNFGDKMNYILKEKHVDLLNLLLKMSKQKESGVEYCLTREPPYYKRIINTELSAYGDSNILIKFKVKTIINLKDALEKEYTCGLVRDEFFEGKISFKIDDLAEAETVLQIIYFLTEKLEEMKANKDINKKGVLK